MPVGRSPSLTTSCASCGGRNPPAAPELRSGQRTPPQGLVQEVPHALPKQHRSGDDDMRHQIGRGPNVVRLASLPCQAPKTSFREAFLKSIGSPSVDRFRDGCLAAFRTALHDSAANGELLCPCFSRSSSSTKCGHSALRRRDSSGRFDPRAGPRPGNQVNLNSAGSTSHGSH